MTNLTEARAAAERIVDGTYFGPSPVARMLQDKDTVARALLALTSGTDEEAASNILDRLLSATPQFHHEDYDVSVKWRQKDIEYLCAFIAAMRAEEREACAVQMKAMADEARPTPEYRNKDWAGAERDEARADAFEEAAAAIRERGNG